MGATYAKNKRNPQKGKKAATPTYLQIEIARKAIGKSSLISHYYRSSRPGRGPNPIPSRVPAGAPQREVRQDRVLTRGLLAWGPAGEKGTPTGGGARRCEAVPTPTEKCGSQSS